MPGLYVRTYYSDQSGVDARSELNFYGNSGRHVETRRSTEELAGLVRIAQELRVISIRERAGVQPLRKDAERLIAKSQKLIEKCANIPRPLATARRQPER